MVGEIKSFSTLDFNVSSNDNARSKISKTLSVRENKVNGILLSLDGFMEFIKLKGQSTSSLECFHKTNTPSQKRFQFCVGS